MITDYKGELHYSAIAWRVARRFIKLCQSYGLSEDLRQEIGLLVEILTAKQFEDKEAYGFIEANLYQFLKDYGFRKVNGRWQAKEVSIPVSPDLMAGREGGIE